VVAQTLWRFNYYGTFLPNSYYLKVHFEAGTLWNGVRYLIGAFHNNVGVVLLPLVVVGLGAGRREPAVMIGTTVTFGYLLLFVLPVGGDFMRGERFVVPVLPLLYYGAEAGMRVLFDRLSRHSTRVRRFAWTTLVVVSLGMVGGIFVRQRAPFPPVPSWFETRQITPRNALYTTALWLRAHALPGSSVLLSEMGIIPYYSGLTCYDYMGLVDRRMYDGQGGFHPERALAAPADYLILTHVIDQRGSESGRTPWDKQLLALPLLGDRYREAVRFTLTRRDDELSDIYYVYSPEAERIDVVVYEHRGGASHAEGSTAQPR
jgi:hypothetical protein